MVLLPGADGPIIDEFLASNRQALLDENGEASDWIEIHNPAGGPVDLTGWHLTDDPADLDNRSFGIRPVCSPATL